MQRNWSSLIRPKRIDVDEATHTRFLWRIYHSAFGKRFWNNIR